MNKLFVVLVILTVTFLFSGLRRSHRLTLASTHRLQSDRTDQTSISAAQAIRIARRAQPGTVKMMSLEKANDQFEYNVIIENQETGRADKNELKINAQTGELLSNKILTSSKISDPKT